MHGGRGEDNCACCAAWYGVQNKLCKRLKPSQVLFPCLLKGCLKFSRFCNLMGCKIETRTCYIFHLSQHCWLQIMKLIFLFISAADKSKSWLKFLYHLQYFPDALFLFILLCSALSNQFPNKSVPPVFCKQLAHSSDQEYSSVYEDVTISFGYHFTQRSTHAVMLETYSPLLH